MVTLNCHGNLWYPTVPYGYATVWYRMFWYYMVTSQFTRTGESTGSVMLALDRKRHGNTREK